MRIISRRTLADLSERLNGHKDQSAVKSALDAWFAEARAGHWTSSAVLKSRFRSASIVGADRVVFNIKGNDYRLVVAIDYAREIVWIKWIGSHAEYDRIDVRTVAYERP